MVGDKKSSVHGQPAQRFRYYIAYALLMHVSQQ